MVPWSYWLVWFLAPTLLYAVTTQPLVLVVAVLGVALSRWLPDPIAWLRARKRRGALERAIALNGENVTARRDLATLHLEQRRPKRAVALLEPALQRAPDDAELRYLLGAALVAGRRASEAIPHLESALARDPRIRYGDAHLKLGDALRALGRLDDAAAAYERFVAINGSSIEGWTRLAQTRARRGDGAGAKKAFDEASSTFALLPGFQRRRQWGWYLRSRAVALVT